MTRLSHVPLPENPHEFNAGIVNHALKSVPTVPPAFGEQHHQFSI
jgi:hypothetical protein